MFSEGLMKVLDYEYITSQFSLAAPRTSRMTERGVIKSKREGGDMSKAEIVSKSAAEPITCSPVDMEGFL